MQYTIKYTTNKNGYARVQRDGTILISIPQWQRFNKRFEKILIEKAEQLHSRREKKKQWEVMRENEVMVFGERVKKSDLQSGRKKLETYLKQELLAYATPLVYEYADRVDRQCTKLSIRRAKTRRGSCSTAGAIMLNQQLVHLETRLIRYVIIHEVAHLVHHNHSKRFRGLVEELMPYYKECVREMKGIVLDREVG